MSNLTVSPVDIAISGMRAETARLRTIANNIANANTTRTADGGTYNRMQTVLSSVGGGMNGVEVGTEMPDTETPPHSVYDPGHPDADEKGFVQYPNVNVSTEMLHMMVASRAYQANAAVLKRQSEISGTALELLR